MTTVVNNAPAPHTPFQNASQPTKLSLKPSCAAIGKLIHPDKTVKYEKNDATTIRLPSYEPQKKFFLGILAFLEELCQNDTSKCQKISDKTHALDPEEPSANSRKTLGSEYMQLELNVSDELFKAAVRHTLREVNETLYNTHIKLPDKISGQLYAILISLNAIDTLPVELKQHCDQLLVHIDDIKKGTSKNTDPLYYFIRDHFSRHFEKEGSWSKTWNTLVARWVGVGTIV